MTTRCEKRKAVAELVSGDFEASVTENRKTLNLVPGPDKSPKIQAEKLDEMKTLLKKR